MVTERAPFWNDVAACVAARLGLHFPRSRHVDLRRAAIATAAELGLADEVALGRLLLQGRLHEAGLDVLASHLTIGETYFFRGTETFELLRTRLLPALLRNRQERRRLRLWSAACCTGEEAYSLAMLVHALLPDDGWDVQILATDVNPRFLAKAAAAEYGAWSFRGVAQPLKQRYFEKLDARRYRVLPEIRRMVRFAPMNLVDGGAPRDAQDLILCRNVLMYFTPHQARRAVGMLHSALAPDGWLSVAPCEASRSLFSGFTTVSTEGAILYARMQPQDLQRHWGLVTTGAATLLGPQPDQDAVPPGGGAAAGPSLPAPVAISPPPRGPAPPTLAPHVAPRDGRSIAVPVPVPADAGGAERGRIAALAAQAQALANRGALREALDACARWIAADKLDAAAHHLRALVLLELGDLGGARVSLQRTLYLDPARALAHVALAQVERAEGRHASAVRHYHSARELLLQHPQGVPVPQSDGLDAVQLLAAVDGALALRESA